MEYPDLRTKQWAEWCFGQQKWREGKPRSIRQFGIVKELFMKEADCVIIDVECLIQMGRHGGRASLCEDYGKA